MNQAAAVLSESVYRIFRTREVQKLLEWAEDKKNFYLSASGTNTSGKPLKCHGYQRGFMLIGGDLDIRLLVLVKPTQVGASQLCKALILYEPSHRCRTVLYYVPRNSDVTEFTNVQLGPDSLKDMPNVVSEMRVDPNKRDPDNTTKRKAFKGGQLHIKSAQVPANFASTNAETFVFDEADRAPRRISMEKDQEGVSPFDLAWGRVDAAKYKKGIILSTPTEEGTSNVQEQGAKCRVKVERHHECPCCKTFQVLEWSDEKASHGFKWKKVLGEDGHTDTLETAKTVHYVCINPECRHKISYKEFLRIDNERAEYRSDKLRMDDFTGDWFDIETGDQVEKPFSVFMQWRGWFSRTKTWFDGCLEFLDSIYAMREGDPSPYIKWVQEYKAEVYVPPDSSEEIKHAFLQSRQEPYAAECPDEVQIITRGWDLQEAGYIYQVTIGWGYEEEAWILDYSAPLGCPIKSTVVEDNIVAGLDKTYRKASGEEVPISITAVDAGWQQDIAGELSLAHGRNLIIPTFGGRKIGAPIVMMPIHPNPKTGYFLTEMCVDAAKSQIYQRYKIEEPGAGYIHIPNYEHFDEDFIKQMVAEKRALVKNTRRWVCPSGVRNEALDCMVMNLAMIKLLQQPRFNYKLVPYSEYVAPHQNNEDDDFDMSAMIKAAQA